VGLLIAVQCCFDVNLYTTIMQMNVVYAQLPGRPAAKDKVPLDQALKAADYISLHVPLTAQTRGLVSEQFLQHVQPHAVLINTVSS
jgi:lactate dehydrogenase-like 2-hydroxyacid dehydrogenase